MDADAPDIRATKSAFGYAPAFLSSGEPAAVAFAVFFLFMPETVPTRFSASVGAKQI
jgi:hypothetical protein